MRIAQLAVGGELKSAMISPQEAERLVELYRYEVLDTVPDKALDDLVQLAAYICHAPFAVISLVDADRHWFKSKIRLTEPQTSRIITFCAHTILSDALFVVPDASVDDRFTDNPLVTGDPHIRFYCGAPLTTPEGRHIGTLGVIDREPRNLSPEQLDALRVLSRQVVSHLNLNGRYKELLTVVGARLRAEQALRASQAKFERLSDCTSAGLYIYSGERFRYANPAAVAITGYSLEELQSLTLWDLVHPDFHESLKTGLKALEAGDGTNSHLEFPIIRKDKAIRWLDFTAASIEFDGQSAWIGTAIDVTERKQADALNMAQRQVLEMISKNDPLREIMNTLIRSIEALSNGGVCTVLLVDRATQTLRHGAASTMPEAICRAVEGVPIGPTVGSCGTAAYRKEPVIVTDIANDPLWAPWTEARELVLSHGFKACTSMPIRDSHDDVLGTYAMYYAESRGPTAFELDLLKTSSHLLGIALESTRRDDALRATETSLQRTLTATKSGTWNWNIVTGEIWFDDAWLAGLGYSREDVPPHISSWERLVHSEDLPRMKKLIQAHFTGMRPIYECVNRLRKKDGTYRWNRGRSQVVERDAEGNPLRMTGVDTDIDEQIEEQESALRWDQVFRHAQFGLAYGRVADNVLMAVNEAFAGQRGYRVDELVGKPILPIYAPEVREEMMRRISEIDQSGHQVYESVHQRKDGTTFPVLMEVTVIKNAAGDPVSRVAYALDITDRKRNEEKLRLSEERFRLVADVTNDILWDWDLITDAHWWSPNAREKFGHNPAKEPSIEAWSSRLHPGDRRRVLHHVDECLRSGEKAFFDEYRFLLADGSYGIFLDKGQVVRDTQGKPVRMIGAMIDVTTAKKAYATLERAYARLQRLGRELQRAEENERRRLSRELHDEFGQLLSALRLSLARVGGELKKHSGSKGSVLKRNLTVATTAVERLFLALRELVRGLRPAVLDELGLAAALESMAEDTREVSGLDCRVSVEPDHVAVRIGRELEGTLFRIAQELITNIVRHAEATSATIVLRYADGDLTLTVQDNGKGAKLSAFKGGYGLRGISERAELLGGRVELRSVRGKGTTVAVTIPVESRSKPPVRSDLLTTGTKSRKGRHGKTA